MLTPKELSDLVHAIFKTRETEIGCDDCLTHVAAYTGAKLVGATIPEALQRVEEHLALCSNCNEEYEALREALRRLDEDRAASTDA